MRKIALSLLALLFLCGVKSFSQSSTQQQVRALLQTIKERHYSPRAIDDNFSAFVFDRMFESLDPDKAFFTKADISGLATYKTSLDDELNGNASTFLNKIIPMYRLRLLQADTIISDITSKPFDLLVNEFLSIALDTTWPASEKEKRTKWQQTLKYETLEGLSDIASMQYSQTNAIDKKAVLAKEMQVRLMIKSRHLRQVRSILQTAEGFDNYVQSIYLHVYIDP